MKHGVTPVSAGHSPGLADKKGSPRAGKPFLIGDTAILAVFFDVLRGSRLHRLLGKPVLGGWAAGSFLNRFLAQDPPRRVVQSSFRRTFDGAGNLDRGEDLPLGRAERPCCREVRFEIVPGGRIVGTVAARSVRVSEGAFLKATLMINPSGRMA